MPDTTAPQPRCWVLLYAAGPSLIDRGIEWFERLRFPAAAAAYVHAAILIETPYGLLLVEEEAGGPQARTGTDARARAAQAAASSVVTVTPAQRDAIVAYLDGMRGTPYGYLQIPGDVADMLTGRRDVVPVIDHGVVCSALVSAALNAAGFTPPCAPAAMTPSDLATWPLPVTTGGPAL